MISRSGVLRSQSPRFDPPPALTLYRRRNRLALDSTQVVILIGGDFFFNFTRFSPFLTFFTTLDALSCITFDDFPEIRLYVSSVTESSATTT